MNLIRHTADSLKTGFAVSAKHPGRWLLLTLLMLIPIVNFFAIGALVKIYRNEEVSLNGPKKCFIQGLLVTLVTIIYMIIPIIISLIFIISGFVVGAETENITDVLQGLLIGSGLSISVGIIPYIIFNLIALPAVINFVRSEKILGAFNFYEILDMIRARGWGKYILAWIVLLVFNLLVTLVYTGLAFIPAFGTFISLIVWLVFLVPLAVFNNTYWTKLL